MSSSYDKLFDPEFLSDRWRPVDIEVKDEEALKATPIPLRDFEALRAALADHCRQSDGLALLLDQAGELVRALHRPKPALLAEQAQEMQSRLAHTYEELEDLLEALEVAEEFRPD
jgi:hypothetical protein